MRSLPPVPPAAPSVSRRERKKERTRREIYEAAMSLCAVHGYDAVTVETICQAADVAKATFFLHFPSKAALLFEYGRRMAGELEQALAEPGASAAEDFRLATHVLVEHWLARADVMGKMLRQLLAEPAVFARAADEGGQDIADLIARIVRRGQARGEFHREVAPEIAASVFLSSSLAFLAGALRTEPPLGPTAIRDQFLKLMLDGLLARRGGV